ncbi:hypothetical protein PABG_12071 [Paracoccidioides brasiliensis Pb03]|nr:hypothetical protein PABG_12071 [Paracoccidioides brasiliensis Pb03]
MAQSTIIVTSSKVSAQHLGKALQTFVSHMEPNKNRRKQCLLPLAFGKNCLADRIFKPSRPAAIARVEETREL